MGKKKTSKGSKLLRMSDEEKARYLQHKAEQEQEAKRRREQLIKAWMMKKIKREQAFARLNMAKINMFWHNLLRKKKIEGMRKDIGYLQEWLDFIILLKNRIINNLMEDLEESEAQYSYNFKAHCVHIDNYTEFHYTWVSDLEKTFEEDRDELIETYSGYMKKYDENYQENCVYLKTIIFAQNKNAHAAIREEYEYLLKKHYEAVKESEEALQLMITNREAKCSALWRRIAQSVRLYVKRTDTRRHHMAELRKLDAESATEIAENQDRITKLEDSIGLLKKQYSTVVEENEIYLNHLKIGEKNKTLAIIRDRKNLTKWTSLDKRKITILTISSNDCLDHLTEKLKIVEHCLFLLTACQKYETTAEKLNKWLNKEIGLRYPYLGLPQILDSSLDTWNTKDDEVSDDFILQGTKLLTKPKTEDLHFEDHKLVLDTRKIINRIFPTKKQISKRSSAPAKLQFRSGKVRPETELSRKSKPSTSRDVPSASTSEKPVVSTLSRVVIQAKPQPSTSSSDSSTTANRIAEEMDDDELETVRGLDVDIGHLDKLENFWSFHSKVVVDIMDLKEEKSNLIYDNERLKMLLRLVLESAALQGGKVELETDSSVTSLRSSISATMKSIYGRVLAK